MTPWRTAAVSLVLCLAGVFGDLIESMFKRSVQAKDSSGLFPGIGGLLDVVDSLIFAPPCLYCFLLWSST
jgi:phosphatidate cytidylyltransferase